MKKTLYVCVLLGFTFLFGFQNTYAQEDSRNQDGTNDAAILLMENALRLKEQGATLKENGNVMLQSAASLIEQGARLTLQSEIMLQQAKRMMGGGNVNMPASMDMKGMDMGGNKDQKKMNMTKEQQEGKKVLRMGKWVRDRPEVLNLAKAKSSKNGDFYVVYSPQQKPLTINTMHSWTLLITTINGAAINNAKITIKGEMPEHAHGLPTVPQMTKELGNGKYQVEGLKFQMTGWWEITFNIKTDTHEDEVTFNLDL